MRRYISALLSPMRRRVIARRTYHIPARIPLELAYPTVIREFVPPSAIEALKAFAEQAYAEIAIGKTAWAQRDDVKTANIWGGMQVGLLQERHPESIRVVLAPIEAEMRRRWTGAELIPSVSAFRRILPDGSTTIHWHLDADGTGSYSFDPAWNAWCPLENVGEEYPSLELLVDTEAQMRKLPLREGAYAERSEQWVADNFPNATSWCPPLKRGDCLVFSHFILHRTQRMNIMKGPRIGAELRFTIR